MNTDWEVLVCTVDTTPSQPMVAFGTDEVVPRIGTHYPLEANVLGLRCTEQNPNYLVTIDSLYGGSISGALAAEIGLEGLDVLVVGSHTHFAPGVDAGMRPTRCHRL